MKGELIFIDKSDYSEFKRLKVEAGYHISSLSVYAKDNSLIDEIDCFEIIDVSIVSAYDHKQFVIEELIPRFTDGTIFISDNKYKELFEHEFRYSFLEFTNYIPLVKDAQSAELTVVTVKGKTHKKIIDLSDGELGTFFDGFRVGIYGHEKFKDDFFDLIQTFKVFNKIGEHKILSFFLLGESGVGKTEVARSIYKCLGGKQSLAKINFGNYANEFSLSSLIGSARGYTGSEDGEIFKRVRETDVGVILIDEFEKSNATLFNYFLDVLESGKIISSMADEIDLDGFIIIFTSNISKDDFVRRISPELRSRFDYKCQFTVLYDEDKEKYLEFRVKSIVRKVNKAFDRDLNENLFESFLNKIDVSKFNNMRDLNSRIKKEFINYVTNEQHSFIEDDVDDFL